MMTTYRESTHKKSSVGIIYIGDTKFTFPKNIFNRQQRKKDIPNNISKKKHGREQLWIRQTRHSRGYQASKIKGVFLCPAR